MKNHEVYKNWAYIIKVPGEKKFKTICSDVIFSFNENTGDEWRKTNLLQASQNIRNELDNLYGSVFVCESDESLGGIMNNIYKPGYFDCIAVNDINEISYELKQYLSLQLEQLDIDIDCVTIISK